MRAVEMILWRIIGVLLILVGLVVFASPQITYTSREKVPHTDFTVEMPKTVVVPRAVAVLIIGVGALTILLALRSRRS